VAAVQIGAYVIDGEPDDVTLRILKGHDPVAALPVRGNHGTGIARPLLGGDPIVQNCHHREGLRNALPGQRPSIVVDQHELPLMFQLVDRYPLSLAGLDRRFIDADQSARRSRRRVARALAFQEILV
jgi:hypothetical protein